MAYMDRDHNGFLSDFERDADGDGIPNMDEGGSKDAGRITKSQPADDPNYYDFGLFTLSYIKLAAEQSKDDKPLCQGINQVPFYCLDSMDENPITVSKVDPLDWLSADTDGDGIRDDQDDQDHDDVPNITEYLQEIAAPFKDRKYRQLDACIPNSDSRFCLLGSADVDGDGIPNRDDTDDDGDGLPDTLEQALGTRPAARRHRQRRRLGRLRVLVRARPQRRRPPLPGQGALPQRPRRHRREPGLRRRRPHPQGGVPGLELLRPAAAAELQRRQPAHGRHHAP